MKITCHCGQQIIDQTDCVSFKGHIIPDQDLNPIYDALDSQVIDRLVENLHDQDAAYMEARRIITGATRPVWQCNACGRLYIESRSGRLECYLPATEETEKQILSRQT